MQNYNKKLRTKQINFAEYYAQNGNATESAKLAGYSPDTATEQGCRMLKNPLVTTHVEQTRLANVKDVRNSALERARSLRNKDLYLAELIALYDQIDNMESGNKAKMIELVGKAYAHFSESEPQISLNLNISHDDLVARAKAISAKLGMLQLPQVDTAIDVTDSSSAT